MNLGGGGCGELRSCHCTPALATKVKLGLQKKIKKLLEEPGVVVHACNPSNLGGRGGRQLYKNKNKKLARCGEHLWSQLFGRLKIEDHMSPVVGGCSEL